MMRKLLALVVLFSSLFFVKNVWAQSEDTYVQPIPGLEEVGFFGLIDDGSGVSKAVSAETIRKAMINDNYQAYCATEEFTASPSFFGDFEEYTGADEVSPSLQINVNNTESNPIKSSLLREEGDDTEIDYTSYIGNQIPNQTYDFQADITVGSVYKQHSLDQLCQFSVDVLEQIDEDCSALVNPNTCSLYTKIDGTPYTTKTLYKEWKDSGFSCDDYNVRETLYDPLGSVLLSGLKNVPLYSRKNRSAFLMLVMTQEETQNEQQDQGFFQSLFRQADEIPIDKDAVSIVEISIPEFMTKNDVENNPVQLNVIESQTMMTLKDQEKQAEEYHNLMAELEEKVEKRAKEGFNDTQIINCDNCDEDQDRFVKTALAQIVNGTTGLTCARVESEAAKQIEHPANFRADSEQVFKASRKNYYGTFVTSFLQNIDFNLVAPLNLGNREEEKEKKATFKFYIITPHNLDDTKYTAFGPLSTLHDQEILDGLSFSEILEFNNLDKLAQSIEATIGFGGDTSAVETDSELPDAETKKALSNPFTVGARVGGGFSDQIPGLPVVTELGRKSGSFMQSYLSKFNSNENIHSRNTYDNNERFLLGGQFTPTGTTASSGENGYIEPVAVCNGGAAGAGNVQHVAEDSTVFGPAEIAAHGGECTLYDPSLHNVSAWNQDVDVSLSICDKLYSPVACYSKNASGEVQSLIQNPVNNNGQFVDSSNQTACEYVVKKLNSSGINAKLGLAIWIEESAGSRADGSAASFGIVTGGVENNDLAGQIEVLANTINNRDSWIGFLQRYSEGLQRTADQPFCENPWFVGQIKDMYTYIDALSP